jgi:hypothetical protein
MDRKLFLSYIQNMQRNNPDMTGFQNSLRANSWIAPKPIVEQAPPAGGGGAAPPSNETPYQKRVREAKERKAAEAEAKVEAERRAKSRKEFDDASAWWSDQANVDAAVEWDASNPAPQYTPTGFIDGSGYTHQKKLEAWKTKRREVIPHDDPGTTDYEEYDKKHKERNKRLDMSTYKKTK